MRSSILAALLLGAFAGGCSSTTSGAAPDGGASSSGGSGTAANALSCNGVLECASKCGANDSACMDACVAKGTPDAKTAVAAIVTCIDTNKCEDAACFQQNCQAELATCVTPATGEAFAGTAPAGSVPADLVGKWYSFGELWEFRADGSMMHGDNVSTSGCNTSNVESGTAVVSGTTLTIYFTTGGISVCGGSQTEGYVPNTKAFTYRIDSGTTGLTLHLKEQNCRYSDPALADNYCSYGYDKQ